MAGSGSGSGSTCDCASSASCMARNASDLSVSVAVEDRASTNASASAVPHASRCSASYTNPSAFTTSYHSTRRHTALLPSTPLSRSYTRHWLCCRNFEQLLILRRELSSARAKYHDQFPIWLPASEIHSRRNHSRSFTTERL